MPINELFLPLCLAILMLSVGSGLEPAHFRPMLARPRIALIALLAQLSLPPALAWLLIITLGLTPMQATGLVLIAAAPGGATSNLFTHLARGDVALSVAMTASMSLLAPVWMPWFVQLQLGWLGSTASFKLPWLQAVMQLVLITALPLALGMLWRRLGKHWLERHEQALKKFSLLTLLSMIAALLWNNSSAMGASITATHATLVLVLASLTLLGGYALARLLRLDSRQARCISFETGVQNAGVAMFVAFSQLQLPQAGLMALLYGLLMNIPALLLLFWFNRRSASQTV